MLATMRMFRYYILLLARAMIELLERIIRNIEEMSSLLWSYKVADIDYKRGFRKDMNFIWWMTTGVCIISKRNLGNQVSMNMCSTQEGGEDNADKSPYHHGMFLALNATKKQRNVKS